METPICPLCEQELIIEEACDPYNSENTEDVWVCRSKNCKNYDVIVFNMGDLE